jgi:DNA-binding transcriptional MerR regulator
LWPIGRFALATGLSVPTLRHYDEIGLLPPAHVEPATGYRYYQPSQVTVASTIRLLRGIDLPLESIRRLLDIGDNALRAVLRSHRELLAERASTIAQRIGHTDKLILEGLFVDNNDLAFHKIIPTFPVRDVSSSVRFYVDTLGFTLGGQTGGEFASVFQGRVAEVNIYLRRQTERFTPAECFIFVEDPDAIYGDYSGRQVQVLEPPRDKEWGYRQFTIADPDGHRLHLFRFLED